MSQYKLLQTFIGCILFCIKTHLCFVQVVLKAQSVQEIQVESFDKDLDSDDFLGRWVSYMLCCLISNLYIFSHTK